VVTGPLAVTDRFVTLPLYEAFVNV